MNITGMRRAFALSASVLLLGAWGCGIVRDDDMVVVARVGKEKIYAGDVSRHIALMPFEQRANLQQREQRLVVLKQMVERRILLAEAEKLGIQATPADMLITLRIFLQAQGDQRARTASPAELAAMLDENTVDMPSAEALIGDYDFDEQDVELLREERAEQKHELRKRIDEAARIQKLLENEAGALVQVTDQDILDLYDAYPDRFTLPETVRFRYMSVPDLFASEKVRDQVKAGTPFEQLVKEAAEASGGKLAQELAMPLPINNLPEDVRVPMAEAQPGAIVGPLRRGDDRYDLIQVIERNPPALVPFDMVKEQVHADLSRARRQTASLDYVRQLRDKYEVKIYSDRVRGELNFATASAPDPHEGHDH